MTNTECCVTDHFFYSETMQYSGVWTVSLWSGTSGAIHCPPESSALGVHPMQSNEMKCGNILSSGPSSGLCYIMQLSVLHRLCILSEEEL